MNVVSSTWTQLCARFWAWFLAPLRKDFPDDRLAAFPELDNQ